ncbi:PorV/PorQ family protein [candidate division KSB1 bacterium]|nr:PorV/PorQ family protein [candidate division KSB1 bacterium]
MNKCLSLLFIFVILSTFQSPAQEFNKVGTSGFVFLEIPASARFAALGEAGVTMLDAGSEGLYVNPALTALGNQRFTLNVSYANWYVETQHQAVALTYRVPVIGTFGLQAIYFDFGTIEKTINPTLSQTGSYISLGEYSAGAYAVGLSFARQLTDRFAFGASVKYVRENIDTYHADNVVTDIGFVYLTGFHSLRIGTFLQSFGLETKYAGEKFKMPQQLKMGLSGELLGNMAAANRLTLLAEAVQPNDNDGRIHMGMEGLLLNALYLRGGYKFGYEHENLCLGFGLAFNSTFGRMRCDFAYMKHKSLDQTMRYTLAMEF